MNENLWSIAVDAPLQQALTYKSTESVAHRGASVTVPLGRRKARGVVLGPVENHQSEFELKFIEAVDDERPKLPDEFMKWLEWLASYYLYPVGQVFSGAFPPLAKHSRIKKTRQVVPQLPFSQPPELTDEQKNALNQIQQYDGFQAHLVHGVTGSGKTEIYMHAIAEALKTGKTALVLVPEISLTPQLVQRFAARFPDQVSVIHSHLTEREKTNQWWNVVDQKTPILIGARSALFCPIENLGIVVVDEEHEPSFKQDEKLKYHARDAAIVRAKLANCPILLGSATPSLESWHNAQIGKYNLISLKSRVANRKLPQVVTVDLKEKKDQAKAEEHEIQDRPFWLTEELETSLVATMKKGEQAAVFLNRRGVAQMAVCKSCGHTYECPNCAISLTLHGASHMVCHYCDYSEPLTDKCPACESSDIETIGLGTEQIENDLAKMFPFKVVARADRDEITKRSDLEALIEDMEKGDIDILVGTQMIAKGLDFPKLTLVGLALADIGMNLPDFRAAERSFQLLTQVAGRAGRHQEDGGQVVIQTFNPEHVGLKASITADYEGFAKLELEERQALNYPPFGKLALVKLQAKSMNKAEKLAEIVKRRAQQLKDKDEKYQSIQILGPCPAPLVKIRNTYRYQMLLKAAVDGKLHAFCFQFLGDPKKWAPSGTKVQIDIDPLSML
ncbi:MAG: primosomal protein N' [Bdellovibrionales bacterium]|nr:primosomal protein N' [Bdellovibrionales bacterium]